ncbi:MAG: arginine--tRNA ligase domain-containing protein, partial [Promethearchaeota archaeon]
MPDDVNDKINGDPIKIVEMEIKSAIDKILRGMNILDAEITFEIPPDPKFGDLSTSICMGLARTLKKKPREIATTMLEQLNASQLKYISKIEVAGPGYVNFYYDWTKFMSMIHSIITREGQNYGSSTAGRGKKVIVEHTSANPNKPIHLGTARCAILGDLVGRIMKFTGYDVEIENYVDDLGRQVAVLLYGYNNFKDKVPRFPDQKDDYYLGLIYVEGANDLSKRPDGEKIIQDLLKKMEDPGSDQNKQAKRLVDMALTSQLETLWTLNIFYDVLIWERHIVASGLFKEAINLMLEKNPAKCFKVKDGPDKDCVVLNMSSFGKKYMQDNKPYKILVRSNGVATYTGKDVAFQIWKFGEARGFFDFQLFKMQPNNQPLYSTIIDSASPKEVCAEKFGNADMVINVIGHEQKFPQQVVKAAMKILGFEKHHDNSYHLSFKHVWLPGQK